MKPKFKVGQKVRLKPEKQIKKDYKEKGYTDYTGLIPDMPYGKIVKITKLRRHPYKLYYEYKIIEDDDQYYYDEKWFEDILDKKINKILKI